VCERNFKNVPCLSGPESEAQKGEAAKPSFVNESFSLASFGERRSLKLDPSVDKEVMRRCRIVPKTLVLKTHVRVHGGSR
jgi:hypothetical protein